MMLDKNFKPRLIILSDMWGKAKSDWVSYYIEILKPLFETVYYDCRVLAEIPTHNIGEAELHGQFTEGGISKAVENLVKLEVNASTILGFSIGGTVAWKSCLQGLSCRNIYAVSSTRLRKETEKPAVVTQLIYGENDPYKPDKKWYESMRLPETLIKGESHNFYRDKIRAYQICEMITKNLNKEKP
ncbi:alpha/beta hydrolase [Kaistella palustris]|uniref:alpha/beta hydrolase n=1 Tax=Kaistella palustris TaxID=493376 RepID=UPI0012EC66F0|nr:alpha/beta hydrolase [Kaistella palustris]